MKPLEDIIKDRLEGYESPLPEGSMAEFRALRDAAAASRKKKKVLPLVWTAAAAAAAALALILVLSRPHTDPVPSAERLAAAHPQLAEKAVPEAAETSQRLPAADRVPADRRTAVQNSVQNPAQTPVPDPVPSLAPDPAPEAVPESGDREISVGKSVETVDPDPFKAVETVAASYLDPEPLEDRSPFVPEKARLQLHGSAVPSVRTASLIGGGALAAAAVALVAGLADAPAVTDELHGIYGMQATYHPGESSSPSAPRNQLKKRLYYFPVRTGLSARFPISEGICFTTGIEYTLYATRYSYSLSGDEMMKAHYFGVPLRLDWNFLSGEKMDLYAGAGISGDFCAAAFRAGSKVKDQDGLALSLLAAGGIQWNMGRRTGLYIEPQLSWTPRRADRTMDIYRKIRPLMFTVESGLRINF